MPRGSALLADVSSTVADNGTMMLVGEAPALKKSSLKAGRNDSVASIASRYRVSAAQVAEWNSVSAGAKFAPGQTVVVYVPGKGRKSAAPRQLDQDRAAATRGAGSKAGSTHSARIATPAHKRVLAKN